MTKTACAGPAAGRTYGYLGEIVRRIGNRSVLPGIRTWATNRAHCFRKFLEWSTIGTRAPAAPRLLQVLLLYRSLKRTPVSGILRIYFGPASIYIVPVGSSKALIVPTEALLTTYRYYVGRVLPTLYRQVLLEVLGSTSTKYWYYWYYLLMIAFSRFDL
jgi:hypothetical protein